MPEIISFAEAIAATDGKDRTLVLGNGFEQRARERPLLPKADLFNTIGAEQSYRPSTIAFFQARAGAPT